MQTRAELEDALKNADAAGDTAAATQLANALHAMGNQPAQTTPAASPKEMSIRDSLNYFSGLSPNQKAVAIKAIGSAITEQDPTMHQFAEQGMDTAAPVAGALYGAKLGSSMGPVGAAASTGLGAMSGWAINRLLQSAADRDPSKLGTPGDLAEIGVGSTLMPGAGKVIPTALKLGGSAVVARNAGDIIDTGKPTSPEEDAKIAAFATVLGGMGAKLSQGRGPAPMTEERLNNANKDAVLARMKQQGDVVVVPSSVNPSIKNQVLESITGIQNVEAGVGRKNQPIINAIGRKEASLGSQTPINEANLRDARQKIADDSYALARKHGFGQELDDWREAATNMKQAEKDLNRGYTNERGDAVTRAEARLSKADKALNDASTKAGVAADFAAAKKAFAKNFDVEDTVLSGTDEVQPEVLSAMLEKRGEGGLTGGLRDIAQFHNAFQRSTKNPNKMSTAPGAVSTGTGIIAGGGNPAKTVAMIGGFPILRRATRSILLSPSYQASNAVRNYPKGLPTDNEIAQMMRNASIQAALAAQRGE